MRYRAVIFDLFGTLVDNFVGQQHEQVCEMAELLGLEGHALWQAWTSEPMRTRRASGYYDTFEESLADVCAGLGVTYDPALVPQTIELRTRLVRENMLPRSDTVSTLETLRGQGYRIGLVSDCSWEVPVVWPDTPMAPLVDAAIFSCSVKLKKPDPRIYMLICEKLAVEARECLYIGDCGCDELAGAQQAGMDAALICVPYEEAEVMKRPEAQRWRGPRVSSVEEVLDLVKNGRGA